MVGRPGRRGSGAAAHPHRQGREPRDGARARGAQRARAADVSDESGRRRELPAHGALCDRAATRRGRTRGRRNPQRVRRRVRGGAARRPRRRARRGLRDALRHERVARARRAAPDRRPVDLPARRVDPRARRGHRVPRPPLRREHGRAALPPPELRDGARRRGVDAGARALRTERRALRAHGRPAADLSHAGSPRAPAAAFAGGGLRERAGHRLDGRPSPRVDRRGARTLA